MHPTLSIQGYVGYILRFLGYVWIDILHIHK